MVLTTQVKKYIRSLSLAKQRQKYNKFIAEGPKVCSEYLDASRFEIEHVVTTADYLETQPQFLSQIAGSKLIQVNNKELSQLSNLRTPNKILIVATKLYSENPDSLFDKKCIFLNGIQDPGNVGTIIRIADWYGIDLVIADKDSAEIFSPKVIQSAMGSHNRVELLRQDFETLNTDDTRIVGLDLKGIPINQLDTLTKGMLVVGNEANGIRTSVKDAITELTTIPSKGGAESLNAAVATGIACQLLF